MPLFSGISSQGCEILALLKYVWGSSSRPPPLTLDLGSSSLPFLRHRSLALSSTAHDLGRGVAPLGRAMCAGRGHLRPFSAKKMHRSQQTPSSNNTREGYMGTSPDGQYQNQIEYILCSQRWISSIQSAKTRPGADCGSNHELLIAKFRLKLKEVGKNR